MAKKSRYLIIMATLMVIFSIIPQSMGVQTAKADTGSLLTSRAIGKSIAAGQYVFWTDDVIFSSAQPTPIYNVEIYGYDRTTSSTFLVSSGTNKKGSLASDGTSLAWIEEDSTYGPLTGSVIKVYDIATNSQLITIGGSGSLFGGISVDNGVLYYGAWAASETIHGGSIVGRNITTGLQRTIILGGQGPIARGGRLLWLEEEQEQGQCITYAIHDGTMCQPDWKLMTAIVNPQTLYESSHVVVSNTAVAPAMAGMEYNGYDTDTFGTKIVWAQYLGKAYWYDTTNGITTQIPYSGQGTVNRPMIFGDNVVWTEISTNTSSDILLIQSWAAQKYSISTGVTSYIVLPSSAEIDANSLGKSINGSSEIVTYRVQPDTAQRAARIYTSGINQSIAAYPQTINRHTANACTQHPVDCGQVHLDGPRFHAGPYMWDNGGIWKPAGVAYFEPDTGINSDTFTNVEYNSHQASRLGWLDRISNRTTGLAANLVRVFIPVAASNGGVCTSEISNANIVDFL